MDHFHHWAREVMHSFVVDWSTSLCWCASTASDQSRLFTKPGHNHVKGHFATMFDP